MTGQKHKNCQYNLKLFIYNKGKINIGFYLCFLYTCQILTNFEFMFSRVCLPLIPLLRFYPSRNKRNRSQLFTWLLRHRRDFVPCRLVKQAAPALCTWLIRRIFITAIIAHLSLRSFLCSAGKKKPFLLERVRNLFQFLVCRRLVCSR